MSGHRTPARRQAIIVDVCRLVAHPPCQQGYGASRVHDVRQPFHLSYEPRM
ncbi:hypothetical protein [Micromonospora sp. NPDC049359]|uniref:hypothetical protein n=1 Tax=Micromonospora sp. NPDC049359 TaxID=3364270 RepID=UPI00379E2696